MHTLVIRMHEQFLEQSRYDMIKQTHSYLQPILCESIATCSGVYLSCSSLLWVYSSMTVLNSSEHNS